MEEAPNARRGVAELDGPGQETFELTSWMERARKSPSRQRDVVEIAAEVVAASEESFGDAMAGESEAEAVFEEAVEAKEDPTPVFEDTVVAAAAVEDEPDPVFEDAVVAEAAVEEPQPASEGAVVVEAAVEEASEDTEGHAFKETAVDPESPGVDDRDERVRASTNGNGHKPPSAHEVVVEINGHKSEHQVPSELIDTDDPRATTPDETLPSMNGNGAVNGHSRQVTSPNGEGMPAIERPLDDSDAEAGDVGDQMPDIVHDVRIQAATNGGQDETINIQIGIHLQSKALRMKRWEVKDEPFEGFKSPPGRF